MTTTASEAINETVMILKCVIQSAVQIDVLFMAHSRLVQSSLQGHHRLSGIYGCPCRRRSLPISNVSSSITRNTQRHATLLNSLRDNASDGAWFQAAVTCR
jgi:hypothetical protein